MHPSWQDQARKIGAEDLVSVIEQMASNITQIKENLETLMDAFPDGDIAGHKRYHETMIQMLEEKRQLKAVIKEKTIGGFVWAIIIGTATLLWRGFIQIIDQHIVK